MSNAPPSNSLQQSYGASSSPAAAAPTSSNQLAASTSAPSRPAAEQDPTYGPLLQASKTVDGKLQTDEQWVTVGDRLGSGSSFNYVHPPSSAWAPFQKRRTVSLPDQLFDAYTTSAYCTMGLLPEIERAWVTIDNRLLLWDWADGSSFSSFDDLTSVIIGVGIVRPRPGVFVDSITHLLVLTTLTSVTLVGLGYAAPSPGAKKEVTFYLTGLTAPTDGLPFTKIKGTAEGRIFLCTSAEANIPGGNAGDGCLYELAYQSTEGWFVKRCTLRNHTSSAIAGSVVPAFLRGLTAIPSASHIVDIVPDNERGLLYTVLRNGSIEMYELSSSSATSRFDGVPRSVVRSDNVLQTAKVMCKTPALEASGLKLVAVEVISIKEGEKDKVALVAITNTGVRIYFSHQRRFPSYSSYSARVLEVFHVRPPPLAPAPPSAASAPPSGYYGQQQPPIPLPIPVTSQFAFKDVFAAQYASGGLFLAANNRSDEFAVLFVCAPDHSASIQAANEASSSSGVVSNGGNAGMKPTFAEIPGVLELMGATWSLVEVTPLSTLPMPAGKTALNELATQMTGPRREWVVLTDAGASIIARMRPVDTLVELIEGSGMVASGPSGDVNVFFNAYGPVQTLSMLIAIAAGNSRLALAPPSDPTSGNGFASTSRSTTSVAEQARGLIITYGGHPVLVDQGGWSNAGQGGNSKLSLSWKHDGFAFYLARLLRPVWTQRLTLLAANGRQISNVSDVVLTTVQRDLVALRTFVEQEHLLFVASPPDGPRSTPEASSAYASEHASLMALRQLLTQSVEAISFILLLIDYQISDIIAMCDDETQKALLTLSYQDLLTKKQGKDIARTLVSAVINQQIGRQLSVDAISDTLQQRCGSFCSADDVLLYKGIEAIRRAKDTVGGSERTESLRESLRLFIKASAHLSLDRMKDVCAEYNAMRYPLGSIDLAVSCAHAWDSSDRAVTYWMDGCPENDSRQSAYELRKSCYELVFAALQNMDEALNEASNPAKTGGDSYAEVDVLRTNAYNKALSVQDELFHSALYDWYLSRDMTDQLLEIRTPYLEAYLSREPTTLQKSDLLWQLYVRTGRYPAAAAVLASLADTAAFPLSVHKRVEYLSLAVGNAKSQFPSTRGDAVQFLTEVEEKLEVAQVQIEIYRAIEESDLSEEERRQWLDKIEDRMYTISELYSDFAEPLQLLEIVLLIFHVSDHRDPFLVTATWEAILTRAQEESPDSPIDALAAKVVELGRRFHSSDVAFPLATLANMLEKFSYEHRAEGRPGWVPLAFHEAGTPWEPIFAVFDELLMAKVPPWHNPAGLTFLAADAAELLSTWLSEASSMHLGHFPSSSATDAFPATEVDTAVGKWLMGLASEQVAKAVTSKLQEVQREVRRRF